MSKKMRNRKKGSALITTVLVSVLVCALIILMMSLSLYGQSLAKAGKSSVIRQDRLDLLAALFLEFGVEPVEDFGYDLEILHFDSGRSVMTVRDTPQNDTCTMLVERDEEGRITKQLYNVYYPYRNYNPNRALSIHTETDFLTTMRLRLDKEKFASGGPFRVVGKWKLDRAVPQNGAFESYAFVSFSEKAQISPCESIEFVHKQFVKDQESIQWKLEKMADGTGWRIKQVSSGLYLDVARGTDDDIENDRLALSPYDANAKTQIWQFSDHWGFIWQLKNYGTGLWLAAEETTYQLSFSEGDPYHFYNYPYFSVTLYSDFVSDIDFFHNKTVLDLDTVGDASVVITPRYEMDWVEQHYPLYAVPDVQFVHKQAVKDQETIQWELEKHTDGVNWRLKQVSSGMYLDVANANDGNDANDVMTLTPYNASSQTQVWEFIPYYTYKWQLRNKSTGLWAIVDQETYNITFSANDPTVDFEHPYFSVTKYADYGDEISYDNNVAVTDLSTVGRDTIVITPRYEMNWVEQDYPLFIATEDMSPTQNRLTKSLDGWIDIKNSHGNSIVFGNLTEDVSLVFGLKGMSGHLSVADLVIVNAAGQIVYSAANDPNLYGIGDMRAARRGISQWDVRRNNINDDSTAWPVFTRETADYIPNRVVGIDVPQAYDQDSAALIINPAVAAFTQGTTYTLSGRIRVNIEGASAKADLANLPKATITGAGVTKEYLSANEWVTLVNPDGTPITFVGGSSSVIKFNLCHAYGTLEVADIKITDSSGAVIYDMGNDAAFASNVTHPALTELGGCWKPFAWTGTAPENPFVIRIEVNPVPRTRKAADYQRPVFTENVTIP